VTTQRRKLAAAFVLSALMIAAPMTATAGGLGNLLMGAAGLYGVKLIAGPLNTFINKIMLANHVATTDSTKVVPIVSVGSGTYVGAAQVSGPAAAVGQTQAVGSLEVNWNNGTWQGDALIPINNINPLKGFKRVYGVGVDAVINARV